jgi:hypothetical protein
VTRTARTPCAGGSSHSAIHIGWPVASRERATAATYRDNELATAASFNKIMGDDPAVVRTTASSDFGGSTAGLGDGGFVAHPHRPVSRPGAGTIVDTAVVVV